MRKTEAYITSDGKLFTSHQTAQQHADNRYGDALSALAHKLVRCEKYSIMLETLDSLVPELRQLYDLKYDADHCDD